MPRFPACAATARGLSDRVFGQAAAVPEGQTLYPLHVGDTYLEPLAAARAEAQLSAEHPGLHNYAPGQGMPQLLDAIVERIEGRTGVQLERSNVQVMAGATGGLGTVCSALLEPGDEVLLPSPFWPLIRGIIRGRGAAAVEVPLFTRLAEPHFDPVAALQRAITSRTVAIYLNSPHNPTGAILPRKVVDGIAELVQQHDLWVLSDEVYEDSYFGPKPPDSLWAHPGLRSRTIATHSISKAYGLAGSRVGYTHGPAQAMEVIRGVQTFYSYCAPRPLQIGAARALREGDGWLAEMRALYGEAARAAAQTLGLAPPPAGTFLFFDTQPYRKPGESGDDFLRRCQRAGVMLTPGGASGEDFAQWARLCFTSVPPQQLAEALKQLGRVLADRN